MISAGVSRMKKITVIIRSSEVKEALGEYGYEASPQRINGIMEAIATSRYVDADEIIRHAIETLADEQHWQLARH